VQRIVAEHGITRVVSEEGGRTNRGSIGLMKEYVAVLNQLHEEHTLDLQGAMAWWIQKVHAHFASEGPKFNFDPGSSLQSNIKDLLAQATALQECGGGTNYVGAMLQHLVGAKLEIVLGPGNIQHHGFSVADQSTDRKADYQIENVAIHVTTHPGDGLMRKCAENTKTGLKPVVVTIVEAVEPAKFALKNAGLADRVDVIDIAQFLVANVYERSLFRSAELKSTLSSLLRTYNTIVAKCETDPALQIRLGT
jgi:hypothetical protein